MKIGIIGGGGVGQTLGTALIAQGHSVTIGIRAATPDELAKPRAQAKPLAEWITATGGMVATMADAATGADLIINATHGESSIAALTLAGAANLAGKVLIDVGNPLDFSQGMPPALTAALSGHTSLAEQIQAAFPTAKVVKAFNTIGAAIMVNPSIVAGAHDLLIAGNDAGAKDTVTAIARGFGWQHVVDLGDIKGARSMEAQVLLWMRVMEAKGGFLHNIHIARS
jgi:8-hydroxy-5-deazaflavin:NADPH oxidoreductase